MASVQFFTNAKLFRIILSGWFNREALNFCFLQHIKIWYFFFSVFFLPSSPHPPPLSFFYSLVHPFVHWFAQFFFKFLSHMNFNLLALNKSLFVVSYQLDSIFKSRDITLPTKVRLVKAMVFPVVMYGCESWTVKKTKHQRIDAFELWCWRRLLRVPWTARRSNQSILKEISPGCCLEGMMLKLKLQYFGHLMQRVDSLEKALMLGGIGGRKRRGQ